MGHFFEAFLGDKKKYLRSPSKKKAQFVEKESAVIFTQVLISTTNPLQQRDCGRSHFHP